MTLFILVCITNSLQPFIKLDFAVVLLVISIYVVIGIFSFEFFENKIYHIGYFKYQKH